MGLLTDRYRVVEAAPFSGSKNLITKAKKFQAEVVKMYDKILDLKLDISTYYKKGREKFKKKEIKVLEKKLNTVIKRWTKVIGKEKAKIAPMGQKYHDLEKIVHSFEKDMGKTTSVISSFRRVLAFSKKKIQDMFDKVLK